MARFDYDGEEDGDLSFSCDDVIQLVSRRGDEWLEGELGGRKGIFPVSFVDIIEDLPPEESSDARASIGVTLFAKK